MYVICIDANGFEDQLTYEAVYKIDEQGANSYLILNDEEQERWYGKVHFSNIIQEPKE